MFRRILVPTDFSAPSDAALEYARGLAAIFGASLHLLHVADDSLVAGSFSPIPEVYVGPDSLTSCKDVLTDAHERLAHRVTSNDRARFRATTEVMFGRAAETIADYAADNGFDLIVMGTHGRSGLAHLFMGSVAERVVRTARCPVLTTHAAPGPARVAAVGSQAAAASL